MRKRLEDSMRSTSNTPPPAVIDTAKKMETASNEEVHYLTAQKESPRQQSTTRTVIMPAGRADMMFQRSMQAITA